MNIDNSIRSYSLLRDCLEPFIFPFKGYLYIYIYGFVVSAYPVFLLGMQ